MSSKNERIARAIIAMKLIVKTATGYTISTPAFRGQSTSYEVTGGKCTCLHFEENRHCVHIVTVEMFDPHICKFCDKPTSTGSDHFDCELGVVPAIEKEMLRLQVKEILESLHVSSVEVALEETFGNVRVYSAITKDRGVLHRYRVRVEDSFETGERVTVANCNCQGNRKGFVCRHIAQVAKTDSERLQREIYPNQIANYRAYKRQQQLAA